MTLTLRETQNRLQTTDFEALPKPRKNKAGAVSTFFVFSATPHLFNL